MTLCLSVCAVPAERYSDVMYICLFVSSAVMTLCLSVCAVPAERRDDVMSV